jgi:hypothetical protein
MLKTCRASELSTEENYKGKFLTMDVTTYEGKSVNKSQKAMKKILSEIFT